MGVEGAVQGQHLGARRKALGASCDWTRERFTLDDDAVDARCATRSCRLYDEGLIYRAHRLINWCPRCLTALSDLEVVHKDVDGGMWDFAYPVEGGGEIVVSTTRPETMLGDTAIAVHPDDERYRHLVGTRVVHPFVDRTLPGRSPTRCWSTRRSAPARSRSRRRTTPTTSRPASATALERINILNEDGHGQRQRRAVRGPGPLRGPQGGAGGARREGPAARREDPPPRGRPLPALRHRGRAVPVAAVVRSMRSRWPSRRSRAVRDGEVRLVPDFWVATYENWLENILDWCISRQLWWGHRIPAFYCADGHTTVAETDAGRRAATCGGPVRQDEDVLDTWFSSGLWPISTLGWPDDTADMRAFYPTATLITGFDILFFWVARMIMMSCHFTGKAPFATVHLTGPGARRSRQKMSKTKGNVIDPLDLVARVRRRRGALHAGRAGRRRGATCRSTPKRMEGYRAFGTKIWNAARFVQMHLDRGRGGRSRRSTATRLALPERWILSELARTDAGGQPGVGRVPFRRGVPRALPVRVERLLRLVHRDGEAGAAGREGERGAGTQGTGVRRGRGPAAGRRTCGRWRGACCWRRCKLLHPVMPFITEEIAAHLGHDGMLIDHGYPAAGGRWRRTPGRWRRCRRSRRWSRRCARTATSSGCRPARR